MSENNQVALTVSREQRRFQRMQRLLFVLFLPVALLSRLLPPSWRPFRKALGGRQSLLQEARHAANLCAGFAFMGY